MKMGVPPYPREASFSSPVPLSISHSVLLFVFYCCAPVSKGRVVGRVREVKAPPGLGAAIIGQCLEADHQDPPGEADGQQREEPV